MIISVVNLSKRVSDSELQGVIRAVNRQIREDFEPHWSLGATLRLEGKAGKRINKVALPELRGDAVLYLWDDIDVEGALGYHDKNARGIPYGIVFTNLSAELAEPWSITLSHEALELIADPHVNLLVAGPHPAEDREVYHWYEMSDAVQAQTYPIDGIAVSNFVLPLYFTPDAELGSRNDFLGGTGAGAPLLSFGIHPGGYIGFFDPVEQDHVTFAMEGDDLALQRLKTKGKATSSRRAYRIGWPREAAVAGRAQRGVAPAASPQAAARSARARVTTSQCASQGLRVRRIG
jgi:hypothetical protein